MNLLEIGNELMCHNDKIGIDFLFNRLVINDVILKLQQLGYERFMWLYDIGAAGGGLSQYVNKYAVLVAYPYYPNQNQYISYLDDAIDYLTKWLEGLNRSSLVNMRVASSIVHYPLLNSIFEEQGLKVKFPCYYAAASCVIETN